MCARKRQYVTEDVWYCVDCEFTVYSSDPNIVNRGCSVCGCMKFYECKRTSEVMTDYERQVVNHWHWNYEIEKAEQWLRHRVHGMCKPRDWAIEAVRQGLGKVSYEFGYSVAESRRAVQVEARQRREDRAAQDDNIRAARSRENNLGGEVA